MTSEFVREDFCFVLAIIDRVLTDPEEIKFRRLRRTAAPVRCVESLLLPAGFRVSSDGAWIVLTKVDEQKLRKLREEFQDAADALLDPDSLSFKDVAEVLQRQGNLPGIRMDINDTPLDEPFSFRESECPRKPWEV
jgi:hypothetical protein